MSCFNMAPEGCCTFLLVILVTVKSSLTVRYEPNWPSIDSRPLPAWYDEAKLGIFIHWGVFSVPSFGSEWFWDQWKGKQNPRYVQFMKDNFKPDFTYGDFAKDFTAEFYNADQWAEIFAASGAKYIVFVSKHHEGFCNWNTSVSFNWNSVQVGPNRDIVAELEQAIRSRGGMRFGLYHSLFEWFNPLFLKDQASGYRTTQYVDQKTMPELYELITMYKPDIIWSDGDARAPPDSYWKAPEFLAWLYNDSPVKDFVVTNDRWGNGTSCQHGGFFTCGDRHNPGKLQTHKWENAMTIDRKSWGFRREANLEDYLTTDELIATFAETVSCGGNMLMNVGPTKYGVIIPLFEERLRDMGAWLQVNGEAIYSSRPWIYQNDTVTPGVWYTQNQGNVYAIVLNWPQGTSLELRGPEPSPNTTISLLGYPQTFTYQKRPAGGIIIDLPPIPVNEQPTPWALVLKFQALSN